MEIKNGKTILPIQVKTQRSYDRFRFLNQGNKQNLDVLKNHDISEENRDSFYEAILVLKKFLPIEMVSEIIKYIQFVKRKNMFFTPPKNPVYNERDQKMGTQWVPEGIKKYEEPYRDFIITSDRKKKGPYLQMYTDPSKKYYKTIPFFCDMLYGIVCDCEKIGELCINGCHHTLPIKSKKVTLLIKPLDLEESSDLEEEKQEKTFHKFEMPLFLGNTMFVEKLFECDCHKAYYIGRLFKEKIKDLIITDELTYNDSVCISSKVFDPYLEIIKREKS